MVAPDLHVYHLTVKYMNHSCFSLPTSKLHQYILPSCRTHAQYPLATTLQNCCNAISAISALSLLRLTPQCLRNAYDACHTHILHKNRNNNSLCMITVSVLYAIVIEPGFIMSGRWMNKLLFDIQASLQKRKKAVVARN